MDLTRELLEQIEANTARALVLAERNARLLLTLTERAELPFGEWQDQIVRGRKALADALGPKG